MSEKLISVNYQESKMGTQNFTSSSFVGLMFTASKNVSTELDVYNPGFVNGAKGNLDSGNVGYGYGAEARNKLPATGATDNVEILVGAGWRSVSVEQQINVTQEGGMGHFDLLETISHSVASNTMSANKMLLRLRALNRIGIAPFGKDVLTSPRLNCYIYDPKQRQRGYDFGYLKLYGLHINTNRWEGSNGSPVMENVSFRADRIEKVATIPTGLLDRLSKMFPAIYNDLEQMSTFQYVDTDGK